MGISNSAATSGGKTTALSQIFAEKADEGVVPIHHVGGGALLLVLAAVAIGYINHRANH